VTDGVAGGFGFAERCNGAGEGGRFDNVVLHSVSVPIRAAPGGYIVHYL
jgi:hypothetical protein